MSLANHNLDITKNLKIIESLKADLVIELGQLYQGMNNNEDESILDSMSGLMIRCYILSRRLGIPFAQLDSAIAEKLQLDSHYFEADDVFALTEHLDIITPPKSK